MVFSNFQPSLLVSDEAAVSRIPDVATTMAFCTANKQTILFAGDRQRGRPIVHCQGRNETIYRLKQSLLDHVIGTPLQAEHVTRLAVQHLMHPQLSRPVAALIFSGELEDHPCTSNHDLTRTNMDTFSAKGWAERSEAEGRTNTTWHST